MTLEELVQHLIQRTKRVDKQDEIRFAVRKAIRTVHGAGYFPRDIVEEQVALGETVRKFKVVLPPRVRKFINVAPVSGRGDPVSLTTSTNTYDYIHPADLIDSFFQRKADTYHVSGATLMVNSSVGVTNLYLSYYAIPEVADNNLESWLMREHESVFINSALAEFYKSIGKQSHADSANRAMMQEIHMLIEDYTCMGE